MNNHQRIIQWLALLLLAAPVVVQAQVNYAISGNTAYVAYSPDAAGNIVITNIYNGYPVTSIGEEAFEETALTSVTIPDSVTSIGNSAFFGCPLTSVTIPNSVTSLGDNAFYNCSSLTNATIGTGVTSIGESTFDSCSSLTSVTIPNSVASIGTFAFENCYELKSATIPNSVTSIGAYAFDYCSSLTNATIGTGVTTIGEYAFEYCGLTSVTIPNSVTSIGDDAFTDCTKLKSVTIPNSVTSIVDYAFGYCTSLTAAYFQGNAPPDDGTVFYDDQKTTVYYLPGTIGWGSTFGGVPTAFWTLPYPLVLNNNPNFGVQNNQFGFTVSWATNLSIVVQACTNLANPVWTPIATNALAGGTNYFSDPQWTNYPSRFYRLSSP